MAKNIRMFRIGLPGSLREFSRRKGRATFKVENLWFDWSFFRVWEKGKKTHQNLQFRFDPFSIWFDHSTNGWSVVLTLINIQLVFAWDKD